MSAFAGAIMATGAGVEVTVVVTSGTSGDIRGYISGSLGSIDNDSFRGATITELYCLLTGDTLTITIDGGTSAPAQDFFTSLEWVDDSTTFTTATATYTTASTEASWEWVEITNFSSPDTFVLR